VTLQLQKYECKLIMLMNEKIEKIFQFFHGTPALT